MLVGICGKAGAGKDTIGDHMVDEYGFEKISLADPIKRITQDIFVLDDYTVHDRVAREKDLPDWKGWSVRKLLQFIGTELFRENIDTEIWVKSLWLRVKKNPDKNYVVTDIRFPNEMEFFQDKGKEDFVSIKVIRDGFDGAVGLSGHESEKYDLEAEHTLYNNGEISDLHKDIDKLMKQKGLRKTDRPLLSIDAVNLAINNTKYIGNIDFSVLNCEENNE